MDSGDDPVGYVMCAINAYSSVLVPCSPLAINWSSWSTATHRLSPRACALLGQLAELAAASELAQLAGRCGAGVCAAGVFALARAACVRAVRAAWSSWCVRVCLRAGAVLACVRLRACARGAAHDSYAFCDGHSEDV